MDDEVNKTYFSIGEVAELLGENPSLIRFWEKEFKQIAPKKSAKGTRKFTQKDVEVIKYIHYLVKQKGLTIEGAKNALKHPTQHDEKLALIAKLEEMKVFFNRLHDLL